MAKVKDLFNKMNYILDKKQKRLGILVLALSFIGALLEMIGVSAILPFINVMLNPTNVMENLLLMKVFRVFGASKYQEIVLLVGILVISLYIVKNLFFILLSWIRIKYSCKIQREVSIKMMKSYLERNYSFFLKTNTSELIRGTSSDVTNVYTVLNQGLRLITDMVTMGLIFLFMLLANFRMALILVLLALICLIIIAKFFKKRMTQYGVMARKYNAKSYQSLLEAFQGIKEVLLLNKQDYFIHDYEKNYSKQQKAIISQNVGAESPAYIIEMICVTGILSMVCISITDLETAQAALPTIAAFVVGAFRILPCLGRISSAINSLTYSMPGVISVYNDIKSAENYKVEHGTRNRREKDRQIEFTKTCRIENLSFQYDDTLPYVLKNVNITVNKGESIGIIGKSGAGKSTLIDLMIGLLKPSEGQIMIDNLAIGEAEGELEGIVGYVAQSVYLTDDTVRKNIAFGELEENIDDEKIWNCLEQAQLRQFVEELPAGIDTFVGDRGVRFSGGQKQRIAIARALYRNPQLLILDEATSALDNETEQTIMKTIEALQGKITMIIIAHRLTTIEKCDRILEIRDGHVFENKDFS